MTLSLPKELKDASIARMPAHFVQGGLSSAYEYGVTACFEHLLKSGVEFDEDIPFELEVLWGTYDTRKVLRAGARHQFKKDRALVAAFQAINRQLEQTAEELLHRLAARDARIKELEEKLAAALVRIDDLHDTLEDM